MIKAAALMIDTRWGKIQRQEDYEDSERAAAFDVHLAGEDVVS